MSFEVHCPQCVFVSRQLGQSTPCLLHVSLPYELGAAAETYQSSSGAPEIEIEIMIETADYDEPYAFGQLRPTVDRPGPFTLREYVRLQLLRSRLQAAPSRLDQRAQRSPARSLSNR